MITLPEKYKELVDALEHIEEAFTLLDLINTEFRTDPMSVQCFDLRIVNRIQDVVNWKRENS